MDTVSRKTTVIYDGHGNVINRTVVSRSDCGCGAIFTVLLVLFVIVAPASSASQGTWPLGWAGALLAYIVEAAVLVAGVAVAVQRSRSGR